jgi:hypothetical protein
MRGLHGQLLEDVAPPPLRLAGAARAVMSPEEINMRPCWVDPRLDDKMTSIYVIKLCKLDCVNNITTFQVSATHDTILNEYWSNQQKMYTSIELRPNAIIFYNDGVRGLEEQFGLQNPIVRVKPTKGLL